MIIKYLGLLGLGMSLTVSAADLRLDNVRLNELAKLGYTEILNADFIADNDFNNESKTVSVYLKNKTDKELKNSINSLIDAAGYDVNEKGGIIRISKKLLNETPDLTPFYYKPKYRDVVYLSDQLSGLFKTGNFTFKRQIQSGTKDTDKGGVQNVGNNAQSVISKPLDAFIFNGTKNEINALQGLLKVLDVPDDQVQITAYLYEVSNSDLKQSSFSLAASLLGDVFKINIGGDTLNNSISFKSGNFQAAISALAADSRFNVISSPLLMVKNRQKGSFNVGAETPVLGNVSYQNNGQAVQSVEYKPSGVILDLTPVFRDSGIELTIHHQISNFVTTSTGVNNSPTLIKRELNTVVNAGFQDVILLGGLSELKETKSKSGLWFLPDLLHSKTQDSSKSDILLLLHVNKI
jgi:type II secretory pathway component GspD/PulD (secretin)